MVMVVFGSVYLAFRAKGEMYRRFEIVSSILVNLIGGIPYVISVTKPNNFLPCVFARLVLVISKKKRRAASVPLILSEK